MSSLPLATCQLRLLGLSKQPPWGFSHPVTFQLTRCCFHYKLWEWYRPETSWPPSKVPYGSQELFCRGLTMALWQWGTGTSRPSLWLSTHPSGQGGLLRVCCFDACVPLLSRLSNSNVCNMEVQGAAQPHNLLPNLMS